MLSEKSLFRKIKQMLLHVLILVLMEYALWEIQTMEVGSNVACLNPCFNGICSLSAYFMPKQILHSTVLILVLMEYALWVYCRWVHWFGKGLCLNPCFNGICSLSYGWMVRISVFYESLNPCFNGICSLRKS